MIVFYFTLVFLYNISNIYIANIIYITKLLKDIITSGKIPLIKNNVAILFYLLFVLWVTISTVYYSIETATITDRVIIQYLFTLQYFVLIIPLVIQTEKFELWIYRFAILLSIVIILLFTYFFAVSPQIVQNDMWGEGYIPGWPNSPAIPLLMGLWLSFRKQRHIVGKCLIFVALFLTTSRAAVLGGAIIVCYFLFKKMKYKKRYILMFILLAFMAVYGFVYAVNKDPLLIDKLTVSWDRIDIFYTTMAYLDLRPFLGYGGNTLDQLFDLKVGYEPAKDWGHTHNWILEMLLRYGIIGAVLFFGFIISIFLGIKDQDKKFMFAFFIVLALVQTFMRDFVFLFYLLYLSMEMEDREHRENNSVNTEIYNNIAVENATIINK